MIALADQVKPVEETYDDVERLIYFICHKFRTKYGGDFHEMVSEANLVFMKVYDGGWQPDKGTAFSSFLSTCIYRKLLDCHKRKVLGNRVCWGVSINTDPEDGCGMAGNIPARVERTFDKDRFSNDAKVVIDLVLETPADLAEIVFYKGGTTRDWRGAIRKRLRSLGWASERITSTFAEIGTVV